jgi:hypothetical protein
VAVFQQDGGGARGHVGRVDGGGPDTGERGEDLALVPDHPGPGQRVRHERAGPQDRPGKTAAGNGLLGGAVPPGDDVPGGVVFGG